MTTPFRRACLTVGACVLAVGFSIAFVDRAASSWAHAHIGRPPPSVIDRLTHLVDPLRPAAVAGLVAAGAAAAFGGWRPAERGRTFIAACLAIPVCFEVKEQLKYAFGRTWPETWTANNPSWIGNHAYGFHPFHGGEGWESFPSGHTTEMAALAAILWLRLPRLRWLAVFLVLTVAGALWACDYHYVGDILAGAFVGFACGTGMVALVCGRIERTATPGSVK